MKAKLVHLSVRVPPAAKRALDVVAALNGDSVQDAFLQALRVALGVADDATKTKMQRAGDAYRHAVGDDASFNQFLTQGEPRRHNGIVGVAGSIPAGSTSHKQGVGNGGLRQIRAEMPFCGTCATAS